MFLMLSRQQLMLLVLLHLVTAVVSNDIIDAELFTPITQEELPLESKCWDVVINLIAGDEAEGDFQPESQGSYFGGPPASNGPPVTELERLAGCTADETDPTLCCGLLMKFALGTSAAGCLCSETFLSQLGSSVADPLAALLGVEVDIFSWSADVLLQFSRYNSSAFPTWVMGSHVCCWEGITCGVDGIVTGLEVREDVGLSGTLPEDFSRLTSLQSLNLLEGQLSGTLPATWSALTGLETLSIPNHSITGKIPPEFSALQSLRMLMLSGNSLSGPLPQSFSVYQSRDVTISLKDNRLSGTLPASWSKMTGIARMVLDGNDISGSLPPEWSTLQGTIDLRMGRNKQLAGALPRQWSSLTNLRFLVMSDGQLEGSLPKEWSTMTRLQVLWLGEHYLTGTVPREWSTFSKLHHLSLKSNLLTGSLPPDWSTLQLNTFFISNNWLTGSLPDCWAADAGPKSLGEGLLDFRLNFISSAPEGYEEADNMYNCMSDTEYQRMCPHPWLPVALASILVLSLSGALLLQVVARGWASLLLDCRFAVRRTFKSRLNLRLFSKSNLLLLAALTALGQRLFILSPAFSFIGPVVMAGPMSSPSPVASEILRLLGGNLASMPSGIFMAFVVATFAGRGLLAFAPSPSWLPRSVAVKAWTLVASEDVLRDNLRALRIDQLLLLGMFLASSLLVPLVVSLGLPEVIISREVNPSLVWGINSRVDRLVYIPRGILAILAGSFILTVYSMLAAVLLPGAVVWPSVAVNEAIRANGCSPEGKKGLRQIRRLRWAFPHALLSMALHGASLGIFIVSDFHYEDVTSDHGTPLVKVTWGTKAGVATIVALVTAQLILVAVWNASVWGNYTKHSQLTAVQTIGTPGKGLDEECTLPFGSLERGMDAYRVTSACDDRGNSDSDSPAAGNSCCGDISANDNDDIGVGGLKACSRVWMRKNVYLAGMLRSFFFPEVHRVSRSRARDNALLLVIVLQMVHVEGAKAGLAVALVTWLTSVASFCWALMVRDAPMGFDDIHDCAAFGMVVLANDLATILEADLRRGDDDHSSSYHSSVQAFESPPESAGHECCVDHPAGCPSCQLLLRRFPATLFRMQETLCVSYRWQRQVRAVVRPEGHGPLASSSGVRNQVVGINMTRWQRSELLAAILRSSCTYVWLDVLSIPAALRPMEGSRLWDLSEKLMARMMAVYSAAASTLVLLSNEEEGERYCQRAWTMQEYCGSRALDVVFESSSIREAALLPSAVQSLRKILTEFVMPHRRSLMAFRDEEVERYKNLRQYVRQSMAKAVPLWIRALRGMDMEIEDAEHRAGLFASVVDTVTCQQPVDLVRALVPVLLNTSVQNMDELRVLVRVASLKCPAGSQAAEAMEDAKRLLDDLEDPTG